MAVKKYVMITILLLGGAWLSVTGRQRSAEERQAVATQYSLGAQQMTVYDKCIAAMEKKALRSGGPKQEFCGCLTKTGLSDLQQDESDAVLGWVKNGLPNPAMVTDGQDRALKAAMACTEDTRATWPSVAAMKAWCAETEARRELPYCKLDLK
jgi:hypothetical protein